MRGSDRRRERHAHMNLDTPYQTTHTRAYYQNLHLSYRFGNTTRGVNGPIFSREFCGGSNGNGMIFTQDMAVQARPLRQMKIEGGLPFGRTASSRPASARHTDANGNTILIGKNLTEPLSARVPSAGAGVQFAGVANNQAFMRDLQALSISPRRISSSVARNL